jgi:hypothetical protein
MSIRIFAAVHFWGGSGGLWGVFFGGVIQLSGCVSADHWIRDMQVVPEPTTMGLIGVGAVGLLLRRKTRRA